MAYDSSNINPAVPSFPSRAAAVTPGPTTFDPSVIYAGTAGNVSVTTEGGSTVTFAVQAGGVIPVRVVAVTAASASALVRIY